MTENLINSLSLMDTSGYLIIATIVMLLAAALVATFVVRGKYGRLARDIRHHSDPDGLFQHRVLNRIAEEVRQCQRGHNGDINTQAVIEHWFQKELGGLLLGERFVKSATGLVIILGLVGTFYGLTLSIGKLVTLVSGDVSGVVEITQSLTHGLYQALSGMSVAFSTSLFGIVAAIILTFVTVFVNLPEARTATMVQLEAHLDNNVTGPQRKGKASSELGPGTDLEPVMDRFGQSVNRLEQVVLHFESSLAGFSKNTRDFQEFNLHLKDNIQRMSLCFGDLSDTLKNELVEIKSRDRR
jgi:hypothetical protein